MRILVTGGAGFIGAAVVRALIDKGYEVVVFDNFSTGHREDVPSRASLIEGDVKNFNQVKGALKGVEGLMHFAASIEAGESVKFPKEFFENNLEGGFNVLEAARLAGISRFILSSTAAIYKHYDRPIKEEDDKLPPNPYGASKLALEGYLSAYFSSYGFPSVSLRYFNAYGPGEKHDPETHVIPNFIMAYLNKKPLPMYWEGKQVRDYIYIDDLVDAHIRALDYEGFGQFNLGTGQGTKTADLAQMIGKIIGAPSRVDHLGQRLGDPSILVASFEKAQKALGWEPKTPIREGLERTIDFFKIRKS